MNLKSSSQGMQGAKSIDQDNLHWLIMHINSIRYYKLFNTNKLIRTNATYTLIQQLHIANSSKQVN